MLFVAGLSLSPRALKRLGKISLLGGLSQVFLTTILGMLLAHYLGFSVVESVFIAIALSFSSTIIVTTLLYDKGDLEALYGRISIGFLIVQDIIAALVLILISLISGTGIKFENLSFGLIATGLLIVFGFATIEKISKSAARSTEILFLFALTWLILFTGLFAFMNLPIEIGALLAGIILSVTPYRYEIKSLLKPLRDFFLLFFFVYLGSQIVFHIEFDYIFSIVGFALFVLLIKPFIVFSILNLSNYTKRTSFLTSLTLAQVSEFSFIFISVASMLGYINNNILSIITMLGLITILVSSFGILHANKLYKPLLPLLSRLETKSKKIDRFTRRKRAKYDIILFGCNRIGFSLLESLKRLKKKFLVIDHNPEIISQLNEMKIDCIYGDANDLELLNELNLGKTKMIISTIPDLETNLMLVKRVRELNKKNIIIVVSHQIDEALQLYEAGATYVITPYFLGSEHASTLIRKCGVDVNKFLKEKVKHLDHLHLRKKLQHEHPRRKIGH